MTDQELKQRLASKLPELIKHYPTIKIRYLPGDKAEFITKEFFLWKDTCSDIT